MTFSERSLHAIWQICLYLLMPALAIAFLYLDWKHKESQAVLLDKFLKLEQAQERRLDALEARLKASQKNKFPILQALDK